RFSLRVTHILIQKAEQSVRHHPRRVFLAPRLREVRPVFPRISRLDIFWKNSRSCAQHRHRLLQECLSHRRTTQRSRLVVNTTLKIKTHTHLMMSIRKDNIHQMLSTYNNLLLNETIGG
ncbi:hypothetical protein NECAME_15606, partial [Necator americanus]